MENTLFSPGKYGHFQIPTGCWEMGIGTRLFSGEKMGLWLTLPNLVMTFTVCELERSTMLRTVNHLFRLGPSKNHGYVSHNQLVLKSIQVPPWFPVDFPLIQSIDWALLVCTGSGPLILTPDWGNSTWLTTWLWLSCESHSCLLMISLGDEKKHHILDVLYKMS